MFGWMAAADALRMAAPVPTPTSNVDADTVTPGIFGFATFAAIAIIVVLLIIDMSRRVRRVRYREEIRERLAAEQAGELDADQLIGDAGARPDAGAASTTTGADALDDDRPRPGA